MKANTLKQITHICILTIIFIVFYNLDAYIYYARGFSVFDHPSLPFNTKIQGDHNSTKWYSFVPDNSRMIGYQLQPQLYIYEVDDIPTIVYKNPELTNDTIIYIWGIVKYGFNNNCIVIDIADREENHYWIKPLFKNNQYYNILITDCDFNRKDFHWIELHSNFTFYCTLLWLITLIVGVPFLVIFVFWEMCLLFRKYDDE